MTKNTVTGKMLNLTFSVVVFLLLVIQITDVFRLPILLGVPLNIIAAITLIITTLYIGKNENTAKIIFKNIITKVVFFIKIALPLILFGVHYLHGYVSISGFVRPYLLSVMFFNIFIVTTIAFIKWSPFVHRLLLGAILFVVFAGLAANYMYPNFFYAIKLAGWGVEKDFDSLDAKEIQRTAGFYLKSTAASVSMLLLYPSVVVVFGKRLLVLLLSFLILVIVIFLTGARSGIVTTLMIAPFFLMAIIRYLHRKIGLTKKGSINLGFSLVPLILLIVVGMGAMLLKSAENLNLSDLSNRFKALTTVNSIRNDGSLNLRSEAQLAYLGFIQRQPLTGYGPTYSEKMKDQGKLWLSSHNSYIENSFDFGAMFLLPFLLLIGLLIYGMPAEMLGRFGYVDFVALLGVVVFSYSFFTSSLLDNRSFYFSLGVVVSCIVSVKHNHSGRTVALRKFAD
jgi:O-antigen ligase